MLDLKDIDGMANSVAPVLIRLLRNEQSDLGLHCLLKTICHNFKGFKVN